MLAMFAVGGRLMELLRDRNTLTIRFKHGRTVSTLPMPIHGEEILLGKVDFDAADASRRS